MAGPSTDALADAFADLPGAPRCRLGQILDAASDLARERLEAALAADPSAVSNGWIFRRIRDSGASLGKDVVRLHRGRQCMCTKAPA